MEDETNAEPPLIIDAELCHQVAQGLHRDGREGEAETFYRAALSLAPGRPDSWAALGLAILKEGRAEEAVLCERESLRLDPTNPETHNSLGIAMHALNALAEAENHFRGALRLRPDHPNATLNLGVVRQSLGHLAEAEALYRRAQALGVDTARACNNLALALAEQGHLAAAEQACRDALAASPGYAEAEVNLAMILLTRGHLAEAWPRYEARWRIAPLRSRSGHPEETRWTGAEPVAGRTILLHAEQGFGDTLHFCRYAPLAADLGARVILAVPPALLRLMGSLRGVDQVVSGEDTPPPFDLHCPLMSLPLAFRTTPDTIPVGVPYLTPDPALVRAWDALLQSAHATAGPRIGLVWAGGARPHQPHAAAIDKRRSMTLADMAPLGVVPGGALRGGAVPRGAVPECVFVSLQCGPPARQADTAPFPLLDLTSRLDDFADTAALIETLDLVIAVDTAVAHAAGALGKPVWLLSRFDACWRWLQDRDDTPWYPTMRLFRQTSPGDWEGVIRRVAEALAEFREARV